MIVFYFLKNRLNLTHSLYRPDKYDVNHNECITNGPDLAGDRKVFDEFNNNVGKEDYAAAIKTINQTHASLLKNSKVQSELSMLYAYNKQYDEALEHSFKAIQLSPYNIDTHFVALQVAFLIEDYETALKILPVIEVRFDVDMTKEVLLSLENSQKFIDSAEYQLWLKKA